MKLVLLSSGLGYINRGIEVWMHEVAQHYRIPGWEVELWSGGPAQRSSFPWRSLHGLSRDSRLLGGRSWARRYTLEQLTVLPSAIFNLRRHRASVVYCGDPVLSWHLKRSRNWHRAAVVFMNGMRLSHSWARTFNGIHLLAPQYLEEARQELAGKTTGHFFAVPHFVDTSRFVPPTPEQRRSARSRFGLPQDAFLVLTLGPVGTVSGKRLDFLAAEVARAGGNTMLVSAGADEDGASQVRQSVLAALGDRVRLLGRVERDHIPLLMQAADLYSLAALAEPFGIAIIEALSTGLPVLHHHDPVTTWVSGTGGIPVSMTTPGEAADRIRFCSAHPASFSALSTAARQYATASYSPTAVCHALARELERSCQTLQ